MPIILAGLAAAGSIVGLVIVLVIVIVSESHTKQGG